MLTSTLPSLRARPFLRLTTRDKFLLANSVNMSISSTSSSGVRVVCARDFRSVSVLPNPVQRLGVSWLLLPMTFPARPLQFRRAFFPGMSAKNCRRRYRLCSKISCSRSLLSLKRSFSRPSGDRVDDARVAGLPEECSVSCRQPRSLGIVPCDVTGSRHFPGSLSPFTITRIVSGFLVGVLTIVCGFSRGRFLLFISPIASEQDEDIERKDSLLTTSFSRGFATIFVFFDSVLVICDDALFAGDFSWALDLFVAVSCSDVFRNTSCPLSETALRDLSTGRFCLLIDETVELFTTVPDESILVCTSFVSFSLCFCKAFLTSTGEESSCDLLSLLQDRSCSFFVKRSFSLFAVERGSDFILSGDFCLTLVATETACLDGTFTAVSLSSFTEEASRILLDAGDVEEQA
ncbi:hypothetical protein ALC56_07934 [Trachymyrmex septentrionalis]|uniref:Uncharacterized protein n=1 Tax=Trachymyrmex septentrionalis TaxID=34720 RepID=A0A195FAT8_9HYME|nr:hypothetical protein ALC56_07934 [Trachymyrmex septentrionalis]